MNLLPGDIILIKRGTPWMPFAPFIWLWQRITDPRTPWSWAYHVEMVWDTDLPDIYMAFTLQPPVLSVVQRKLSDLKISAYRLKNRSEDMDEIFWSWGDLKILHTPYILGWSTCGHPVAGFYWEKFGIKMSPYPGPIEEFCKGSDKFERVA